MFWVWVKRRKEKALREQKKNDEINALFASLRDSQASLIDSAEKTVIRVKSQLHG